MAKRRFAQVYSSGDDGEETLPEEMESVDEDESSVSNSELDEEESRGGRGDGGEENLEARPVGDVIKVKGRRKRRREYYAAFEYDGNVYELEDSVLLTPEKVEEKPYVVIVKEITRDSKGGMIVTGQWFYRPEEAAREGGGNFQAHDTRELYYSFHLDEVPAETVMHKCVVHFIPPHKQLPARTEHPGFVVRKVYDTIEKVLRKLTDKNCEYGEWQEIELLIKKTQQRIGDLPVEDGCY